MSKQLPQYPFSHKKVRKNPTFDFNMYVLWLCAGVLALILFWGAFALRGKSPLDRPTMSPPTATVTAISTVTNSVIVSTSQTEIPTKSCSSKWVGILSSSNIGLIIPEIDEVVYFSGDYRDSLTWSAICANAIPFQLPKISKGIVFYNTQEVRIMTSDPMPIDILVEIDPNVGAFYIIK